MKRRGFFSGLYRGMINDGISLENARDMHIGGKFVSRQNAFVMIVVSLLMAGVNAFWIVSNLIRGHGALFSPASLAGLSVGIAVPLFIIIALRFTKPDTGLNDFLPALMHLSIISSSMMLNPIWRGNPAQDGVTLASFWLIACAFIPFKSMAASLGLSAVLTVSAVVPKIVFPDSPYSLPGNLVISSCTIAAYFAFRANTMRSGSLIARLADISYIDFQTNVYNRRALYEYFGTLKDRKADNIGVMMYDIDDFKKYNDEYSHKKGDMVLSRIAEATSRMLEGEKARVFRYNGGEFVAVLENTTEDVLLRTAIRLKDLVEGLRLERNDDTMRRYVTVTVGCTMARPDDSLERDIIGEVDTQLFIGKRGAKNCVVSKGRIFIAEGEITVAQQPTNYTESVARAINEAIENNELKAYYQPKYATMTEKLAGAEALSRWVKPDGTVIMPSEFIPELEKNSSILAVDWYMYEQVCRFLQRQKELGIPQVRISVNFSRMHVLYERSVEQRLCDIADPYGVPHERIEIEITESAYVHLPNIIEPFVRGIRSRGFAVGIDDFGSGASSLEFIKTIDADTIKLDKSMISSNCTDIKERVLLEAVVLMAHRLSLSSVAEGVETSEQMGFLRTLGVDQIQGYIFSKALTEDDFMERCSKEAG